MTDLILKLVILMFTDGKGLINTEGHEPVRSGPVHDGEDDTRGAWIIFGVMVLVAIVAGIVGYFWFQSTYSAG